MAYYSLLGSKMDVSENPDNIPGGDNRMIDQRVLHFGRVVSCVTSAWLLAHCHLARCTLPTVRK